MVRSLVLLLLIGVALTAEPPPPTHADLLAAQQMLAVAETKGDGLRRLILIAAHQLFVVGGVALVTSAPEVDDIQREAARIVKANRHPESIRPLFDDPDRSVRLWAVMGCVVAQEQRESWRPLIPLLIKAATQDPDAGVRSHAVDRVKAYGHQTDLEPWIANEINPWVLMKLYGFSQNPGRTRWYQRAIVELGGDPVVRLQWLQFIAGNVLNPSTAPMWRIEADPALLSELERIAKSGDGESVALSERILDHFRNNRAGAPP